MFEITKPPDTGGPTTQRIDRLYNVYRKNSSFFSFFPFTPPFHHVTLHWLYLVCHAIIHSFDLFPSGSLLLGQGSEAQVRLDDAEVGEQLLGLLILDRGVDNHVVAGDPVDGGGDLVLVARLQRVNDTQDLGRVAARRGRVGQDGADGLLGVDDEDGADREGDALVVDVGGVLVVEPVQCLSVSTTFPPRKGLMDW